MAHPPNLQLVLDFLNCINDVVSLNSFRLAGSAQTTLAGWKWMATWWTQGGFARYSADAERQICVEVVGYCGIKAVTMWATGKIRRLLERELQGNGAWQWTLNPPLRILMSSISRQVTEGSLRVNSHLSIELGLSGRPWMPLPCSEAANGNCLFCGMETRYLQQRAPQSGAHSRHRAFDLATPLCRLSGRRI